jgi:glyoxylase-like metal-dependent hydrolase (beta-lactamase superfamily II)
VSGVRAGRPPAARHGLRAAGCGLLALAGLGHASGASVAALRRAGPEGAAVLHPHLAPRTPQPPLPIVRLSPTVFVALGDTGRGSEGRPNAGFVVGDSGVVVIDALATPRQGERLLEAIRGVTPKPARWLVLTHHHPDHRFGAAPLARAGARVIAHPDRRTLAAEGGEDALVRDWTAAMGAEEMRGFEPASAPGVPVARDTALSLGGRRVHLLAVPGAHTAGDLLVWLPDDGVLFAGDVLVEDGVTLLADGGSSALLRALDRIDSLRPRAVVPGHGRLAVPPDSLLRLTRCRTREARAAMRAAVEAGTRMTRALAALPPADSGRPVSLASRARRNAVRIYLEMEQALLHPDSTPPPEPRPCTP